VNELIIHELTNAGLNILGHYVEETNLSKMIRGLRVDFIMTDDVQKPQCILFSKGLVMVRWSRQFCKLILVHSIPHTYMTTSGGLRGLLTGYSQGTQHLGGPQSLSR